MNKLVEKNYKIICPKIGSVFLIKCLSLKEEKELFDKTIKKIQELKEPLRIEQYKRSVIAAFLKDNNNLDIDFTLSSNYEVSQEENLVITEVYDKIVELYPPFSLESVCGHVNYQLFIADNRTTLGKLFPKIKLKKEQPSVFGLDDINRLQKYLINKVVGQNEAISTVIEAIKLYSTGLNDFSSFFFVGPTGCGKSYLASLVGKKYSGNYFKINCANFANGHEYATLIGAPPGYVGHSDKSLLKEKADVSNKWVFLFDEIEKAHPKLFNFLLALLDEGKATDNLGNELDFTESLFIFTSNQGLGDIKRNPLGFSNKEIEYVEHRDTVLDSIKDKFNPEFINRIDHFVFFNELEDESIHKIVSLELDDLPVKKTKTLVKFIAKNGYSREYGARNIKRFIKAHVASKVADSILEKKIPKNNQRLYSTRVVNNSVKIVNIEDFIKKESK